MRNQVALLGVLLLAGCGGKPTSAWIDQLRSADAAQRLRAVKVLQEKRSEAGTVVPALAGLLGDPDVFVRRDAARALGRFGPDGRAALPALTGLLQDRNPGVRKAAAEALEKIDPEGGPRAKR